MKPAVLVLLTLIGCRGAYREHERASDVDAAIDVASCSPCDAHASVLVPSNVADFGQLQPTGLVIAVPQSFNTDSDCVATSALGTCTVVTRDQLSDACVCRADQITIGSLKVTGRRALVLLAWDSVTITGYLDVSGGVGVAGPGSSAEYAIGAAYPWFGGDGGSFASYGASADSNVADTYGEPTLVPLLAGMTGRPTNLRGGGGGGALQIAAGHRIDISGVINAGGGGGTNGDVSPSVGGGGGGSGGGILLEAPSIMLTGAVVANGGGGGGGLGTLPTSDHTTPGTNAGSFGSPTDIAWGGHGIGCTNLPSSNNGGDGATGTRPPGTGAKFTNAQCTTGYAGGSGGGGGVGRIRINTEAGCSCGGQISPQASFGTIVKS